MQCPKCKKEIKNINIISECWQKGEIDEKGVIVHYGSIEEILETKKIECANDECYEDLTKLPCFARL